MSEAKDVRFDAGADGVAVLTVDVPGERMNILRESFFGAAEAALDALEADPALRAAVIVSGKPDNFIAGADIRLIQAIDSAERAAELCRRGHALMNRIAAAKPIVAAVHGVCLGGGCELALACAGRVLSDAPATRIGLPEVQLGVLPGFGGSQRLPRLIGMAPALDLMLTGRPVDARKARRLGLADEVVPEPLLLRAAVKLALQLADGRRPRRPRRVARWLIESHPWGRRWVARAARRQVLAKTHGLYPAPLAIVDVVERGLGLPLDEALALEIERFAELAVTPHCKRLTELYFAQTALKKARFVKDGVEPRPVEKVAVLGAGLMGSGIALVSLDKAGARVRLKDLSEDSLLRALRHIHGHYRSRVARGALRPAEAGAALARLTATQDDSGLADADLVIEAVFEDLKLKKQVLAGIEALGNERTVFASNTSSIPLHQIARGCARPGNVVGMHYFSPVEKMPLLEVIRHKRSSDEAVATAVAFGRRQGKTVIVVKDVPGFYVNRVLFPYINEAVKCLREGVAPDALDAALVAWGFPVGPFKLLDEVGLDVAAKVQEVLQKAYGERFDADDTLQRLLEAGHRGRKGGRGFYRYDAKRRGARPVDAGIWAALGMAPTQGAADAATAERCVWPLVNEAARCLDEGVIREPRDGDIGLVFGIGFPAFRGGPFRWLDELGAAEAVARLTALAERHGPRFEPAAGLRERAASGARYYSA